MSLPVSRPCFVRTLLSVGDSFPGHFHRLHTWREGKVNRRLTWKMLILSFRYAFFTASCPAQRLSSFSVRFLLLPSPASKPLSRRRFPGCSLKRMSDNSFTWNMASSYCAFSFFSNSWAPVGQRRQNSGNLSTPKNGQTKAEVRDFQLNSNKIL
jgi:hypothetical protein